MKVKNWEFVEQRKPSTMLPAGGYVCKIVDVEDVPSKEYLWVVYDVSEGEYEGIYSDMGSDEKWKHRFVRSYKDSCEDMFADFLSRLQESNRGVFDIETWNRRGCYERDLIGLEIGLVFGEEQYTSDKGEDKKRTVVSYVAAAQDIRCGEFKVPASKDKRTNVTDGKSSSVYDEEIPF